MYSDSKASGTPGGTVATGSWVTRALNTAASGNLDGVSTSLSANQVTIQPGTYVLKTQTPGQGTQRYMCRINNVTDGVVITGTSEWSGNSTGSNDAAQTKSYAWWYIQIASAKTYRVEMQVQSKSGGSSNALGRAVSTGTSAETYSVLEIFRLA